MARELDETELKSVAEDAEESEGQDEVDTELEVDEEEEEEEGLDACEEAGDGLWVAVERIFSD